MIADRTCPHKQAWAGLSLRGIESRICYSSPGLFNCWIGHNYPVPQWARWPNQNGVIHTISIGDKLCWLFCEQLILLPDNSSVSFWTAPQHFISDGSATLHFRRLRNISFQTAPQHFISDGSATLHFRWLRNTSFQTALQHFISYGIHTEMVVTIWIHYNGLFLEQHETRGTIFQLAYNNTIYYTISHMDSLCHGSNSLRVHEQLI